MGSKLPPGASAVPPFRMDMYGKFTINLGVYMPALARQLLLPMPKGWINQYDCHLRQRIGMLFADPADTWWSLADADLAAEVAREAVSHFALPWLESVSTVDDIHRRYLTHGGHAVGLGVGAPLQIALLYIDRGEIDVAEHILRDFLAGDLTVPHRRHVAELLPEVWARIPGHRVAQICRCSGNRVRLTCACEHGTRDVVGQPRSQGRPCLGSASRALARLTR
jgi:hypothetical protein